MTATAWRRRHLQEGLFHLVGLQGESRCLPLLRWKSLQEIHGKMRGQFLSRGIHLPVEKEDLAGMYKLNNLAQAPFYLAIPPQTQIQFWSDV